MSLLRHTGFAGLAAFAVSCGGSGGGGNAPAPAPSNSAPSFTSASSASVQEDASGVFYSAAASDPDSDPVTYSISGGADMALFSVTSNGALSFIAPPNFERSRDAGLNNSYQVILLASDGSASATLTLDVTVTDGPEAYKLRRVATGLAAPLFLTGRTGAGDVFITERAGRIRILNPDTGVIAATPFLDISADIGTAGEGGLLGLALAPDYASSGVFYVHITNLSGDSEIRRYVRSTGDPNTADAGSGDVILTVAQPAANHNGGWLGFGADDYLYIALGDGGGGGDPFANGQDTNTLLGSILRIDPASDDFGADPDRDYAIPADNPFAVSGGAPEIWAYGLRNPFRTSFDRSTGVLYIGDVGQEALEEIDMAPPGSAGLNFGWNIREGTQSYTGPNSAAFTPPVAEYGHGSGPRQGNSLTGGYVYRGPVAALAGRYFFADFISGNVWSIPVDEFTQGATLSSNDFVLENGPLTPDAGSLSNIVSFGEDEAGNLYILTIAGNVFRIEAAP